MTRQKTAWALFLLFLMVVSNLTAQAPPMAAMKSEKGVTASVEFDGSLDSSGNVYELDSSIGYNFGGHFAMDLGIPFYLAQSPTGTPGGRSSSHQIGDPALGLHFKFPNPTLSYNTNLTGTFPTASRHGFSTGRVTYDWSNHFDHAFSWLTPFVDAGVANSIMDSRLYHRPYTTLGYNAHFAAGAKKDVWKFFTAGASAYDILPWGSQKIYSRVAGQSANPNAGKHGRVFQTNAVTTGTADISRDNGYAATLEASPSPYLDLGVGYARSVRYALNTVSFSVGVNLGSIARRSSH
ncbi:MAG TPA: hypothetical protein VES66_11315 [Terriglobales bacterium]|nr:hypothetical protein [Terriglobales bacterium]